MTTDAVLDARELAGALARLPEWRSEGGALVRDFATAGWPATVLLANAIAFLAEAADHHPDLLVRWGGLRVSLVTHSAGGVTARDAALAAEIERLALWRPAPGGALTGPRRPLVRGGAEPEGGATG